MKRMMSLLCILLLCLTTMASAETHTISVWLDEDAIDVTMERWESTLGVSMSYDPVHFAPSTETPDSIRFLDDEHAYIRFLSVADKSMDELLDDLVLQSGQDDLEASDTVIGGIFNDELEVPCVIYTVEENGKQRVFSFLLVQRKNDILQIESHYPLVLEDDKIIALAEITAMMQSIVLTDNEF
jgi:hypothetical protein